MMFQDLLLVVTGIEVDLKTRTIKDPIQKGNITIEQAREAVREIKRKRVKRFVDNLNKSK